MHVTKRIVERLFELNQIFVVITIFYIGIHSRFKRSRMDAVIVKKNLPSNVAWFLDRLNTPLPIFLPSPFRLSILRCGRNCEKTFCVKSFMTRH